MGVFLSKCDKMVHPNNTITTPNNQNYLECGVYGKAKTKTKSGELTTNPALCGEDSFFIHHTHTPVNQIVRSIGICDGVGGTKKYKIDSGFIARQMCLNCPYYLNKSTNYYKNPQKLMIDAYNKIIRNKEVWAGSTTCIILTIDNSDKNCPLLRSASLGDSGYMVVRDGVVVFRSAIIKNNNMPPQLTIMPKYKTCWGRFTFGTITTFGQNNTFGQNQDFLMNYLMIEEFLLMDQDLIILGSDGLWDNLNEDDMIFEKDALKLSTVDMIAKQFIERALERWTKPDDITVICARFVV